MTLAIMKERAFELGMEEIARPARSECSGGSAQSLAQFPAMRLTAPTQMAHFGHHQKEGTMNGQILNIWKRSGS